MVITANTKAKFSQRGPLRPISHAASPVTITPARPLILGTRRTGVTVGMAAQRTTAVRPPIRPCTTEYPTEVANSVTALPSFGPRPYTVVGAQCPTNTRVKRCFSVPALTMACKISTLTGVAVRCITRLALTAMPTCWRPAAVTPPQSGRRRPQTIKSKPLPPITEKLVATAAAPLLLLALLSGPRPRRPRPRVGAQTVAAAARTRLPLTRPYTMGRDRPRTADR